MRRHILHFPFWSEGLLFPIFRPEPPQELDQLRLQLWKKVYGENRLQRFARGIHTRYFILFAQKYLTSFLRGTVFVAPASRRRFSWIDSCQRHISMRRPR